METEMQQQVLQIQLAEEPDNQIIDLEIEGSQHWVQQTWSSFGRMPQNHRKRLIKGLLERCTTTEVDYICSLLNLNLSKSSQVPVYLPLEATKAPKLTSPGTTAKKLFGENINEKLQKQYKTSPRKSINQRMGFVNSTFVKNVLEDQLAQSQGTGIIPTNKHKKDHPKLGITNANMLSKLFDEKMKALDMVLMHQNQPDEQITWLLEMIATRCDLYHSLLEFMLSIGSTVKNEDNFNKIFDSLKSSLNAKYFCIYLYEHQSNSYTVVASNWGKMEQKRLEMSNIINAADISKTNEIYHSYSVKKSDFYNEVIANRYPPDIDCIISVPVLTIKKSHLGIFEVCNRTESHHGSPYFGSEEEFTIRAFTSIVEYLMQFEIMSNINKNMQESLKKTVESFAVFATNDLGEKETAKIMMDNLITLINVDRGHYYRIDSNKNEFVPEFATVPIKFPIPPSFGIPSLCLSRAQIINVKEARNHALYSSLYDKKMNYQTYSVLCAPVQLKGKVVGVIELLNKKNRSHCFDERDERMIGGYANVMSIVLSKRDAKVELIQLTKFSDAQAKFLENFKSKLSAVTIILDDNGRATQIVNSELLQLKPADIKEMKDMNYSIWLKANPEVAGLIRRAIMYKEANVRKKETFIAGGCTHEVDICCYSIPDKCKYDPTIQTALLLYLK